MADLKTTVERRDRFRTWLHDDTRDHLSIRAWCVAEDACDDVDTLLAENAKLRAVAGYTHLARQAMTDGLAECERLRGALLLIATGRFASVAEACDIAEDALGADVVAAWNAAENARAALGEP